MNRRNDRHWDKLRATHLNMRPTKPKPARVLNVRGLTPRQIVVLKTIHLLTDRHRAPPTIGEICAELRAESHGTMWKHVAALEDQGSIQRSGNIRSRHIVIA